MRMIGLSFECRPLSELVEGDYDDTVIEKLDEFTDIDHYVAEDNEGRVTEAVAYQLPEPDHVHVIVWQNWALTEQDKDDIANELAEKRPE